MSPGFSSVATLAVLKCRQAVARSVTIKSPKGGPRKESGHPRQPSCRIMVDESLTKVLTNGRAQVQGRPNGRVLPARQHVRAKGRVSDHRRTAGSGRRV